MPGKRQNENWTAIIFSLSTNSQCAVFNNLLFHLQFSKSLLKSYFRTQGTDITNSFRENKSIKAVNILNSYHLWYQVKVQHTRTLLERK